MSQNPSQSVIRDTMIEPPNYTNGWYAPLISHEVRKDKIKRFDYMGKPLIAFRNQQGKPVVLDAVCPHFGADLGKGDICDGQVRCYFHGFYFDENGQCTKGDLVEDPKTLQKIKLATHAVEECAGQIWIWHGANSAVPDIPLPIKDMNWHEWSIPVTSKRRFITNSNMCYLSENVIDMQHFAVVHKWQLHEVVKAPTVEEDGTFFSDIKVTNNPGEQSEYAIVRALTRFIKLKSRLQLRVYSPGSAIAISYPGTEEDPVKQGRNIVCIYPVDERNVSIRVAVCFKKSDANGVVDPVKVKLTRPLDWMLGKIVSLIAVSDFDGDLKVWNNRQYLSNPRFVKEDGPMLLFRKWYLRFWHPDYHHELINPVTTGHKVPAIRQTEI